MHPRIHWAPPIAAALVAILFAALFATTASMELHRLEDFMADVLSLQARTYVEGIQQSAAHPDFAAVSAPTSGAFSLQASQTLSDTRIEQLAQLLVERLRKLDEAFSPRTNAPSRLPLETIEPRKGEIVTIVDGAGKILLSNGPLSDDARMRAARLALGLQDIDIRLFHGNPASDSARTVAIRRKQFPQAIVLALNDAAFAYWKRAIAIQNAVLHHPIPNEVVYIDIRDTENHLLAQSGYMPNDKRDNCLLMTGKLRDDHATVQCMQTGDIRVLEFSYPFLWLDQPIGRIHVGIDTGSTDRLLTKHQRHAWGWAFVMIVVGFGMMALLYGIQVRHLNHMRTMQQALHEAEKLSTLGKLGAGLAHEIRNPLNGLSMAVQRIEREFSPPADRTEKPQFDRITRIVRDEIRRLNTIVTDFLDLARCRNLHLQPVHLPELIDKTLFLLKEAASSRSIRIESVIPDADLCCMLDRDKMEQALLNLIRNAIDSMAAGGTLTIGARSCGERSVCIRIGDTGSGIPEPKRARIFDPFFTTKPSGNGLGLYIANEIVSAHQGDIRVDSAEGKGTVMEIRIPCRKEDHASTLPRTVP
ncbi:sensor histidine kinase [Desulfatirhabdium butyrativorans]|uniref:sensor histidine kinase n=1 Tax=Desulfatirhabdium butyrativorans TaxID=340467 RepID=UPI0004016E79|nr:ATP-binding protein [Desulfatirhabdium butyrativorans]